MKRSEVKNQLASVREAIEKIEKNDDVIMYITKDKHLPNIGYINEIETIDDLVKAHHKVKKSHTNDFSESIKALGIAENEMPKNDTKILGFKPEHWYTDIETRLKELRTEIKLGKLKTAEAALSKHLSDDDKFDMDTVGIEELLTVA